MRKQIIRLLFILGVINSLCPALAQDRNLSIKIGDQVPDITLNNLINYKGTGGQPATTAKISDFKNELLIINFWSTSCGTCVKSLPKVDALQKEYGGQIQILSVSYEKDAQVRKFLQSNSIGKKFTGSILTEDIRLKEIFSHQFLPHIVVVNKGTYIQSWPEDYFNSKNIKAILSNTDLGLTQKIDVLNFNYSKPIFEIRVNQVLNYKQALYSSAFGGFIDGLPNKAGIVTDSLNNLSRYYIINHTALHMYGIALNSSLPTTPNRRILEVKKQQAFIYDRRNDYLTDWRKKYCYTYERSYPYNTEEALISNQFKNDLDLYLSTNGRIEEREVTCLELRIKPPNKLNSAYSKKDILKDTTGGYQYLHNVHTDDLVYILNEQSDTVPFLDGTGTDQPFDLDFKNAPKSISDWQNVLQFYGFELIQVQRRLSMFILSDRQLDYRQ